MNSKIIIGYCFGGCMLVSCNDNTETKTSETLSTDTVAVAALAALIASG